ncbi:hypothetical protein MNBD_GAMMA19-225, partial [hydrothermal vent metagenome]
MNKSLIALTFTLTAIIGLPLAANAATYNVVDVTNGGSIS